MTTARTQKFHVGGRPVGVARPVVSPPKPDDYVPVSAETFVDEIAFAAPADPFDSESEPFDPSTLDYDPADHTVDEVKVHIEEHPEQADAILELELNGKNRSGLVSHIENLDPQGE